MTTPTQFPFPAWPEIRDRHHPLCLPTLFRAIYVDRHIISGNTSNQEQEAIEKNYIARFTDIFAANYIEQYQSFSDIFPKRNERPDTIAEKLAYLSMTKDGDFRPGAIFLQSWIAGMSEDFYGARDEFSFAHEFVHNIAQWLHSGIVLTNRSMQVHQIINSLMKSEGSNTKLQLWTEFVLANARLEALVHKFEPIEEIFANYLALEIIPVDNRGSIEKELEQKLKEKGLYDAFNAFSDACEIGKTNGFGDAPCEVYNTWCIIYDKTRFTLLESTMKAAYISKCVFRNEEGELLNVLDQTLSLTYQLGNKEWEVMKNRLLLAIVNKFSRPEDKAIFPPYILLIGMKDGIMPVFGSMFPSEQLANGIATEIFLESIRQQLHRECGLHCPYAPINLKDNSRQIGLKVMEQRGLHCPHISNGNTCCGRSEALWNLYRDNVSGRGVNLGAA